MRSESIRLDVHTWKLDVIDLGQLVTRKRSGDRTLPAVEISDDVLRTLEQAIPNPWLSVVTWTAGRKHLQIQQPILEDLLREVSEEEGIDAVGFTIFEHPSDPETEVYFQLWCDFDGCALEYSSPDDEDVWGKLSRFEQTVAGILQNKRRLPWFRAAKISLGKDPRTSWWRLLDWKGMFEKLIVAVIGGFIVGIIILFVKNPIG